MPDQVAIPAAEMVPIERLKPWVKNPRKNDKAVRAVADSITRFGFANPILARREDGRVIAGHTRLKAAILLGLTEAPVRYLDLGEEEADALALADNRLGELAEWDDAALAEILQGLGDRRKGLGWTEEEIGAMLATPAPGEASTGDDDAPEVQQGPPASVRGEVYHLGPHRLICGDSRNAEDVARLLDGAQINLAFTSPPYASQREYDPASGFKPIPPDEFVDWFEAIQANVRAHLAPDGSWFVNIKEGSDDGHKLDYVKRLCLRHIDAWSWLWVEEYCWPRPALPLNPNDSRRFKNGWESVYHFCAAREFAFYPDDVRHASDRTFVYSDQKAAGRMIGGKAQGVGGNIMDPANKASGLAYPSNVITDAGGGARVVGHSAAFPVALPSFFVRAFTRPGDAIYEPFCGSGTTLIAAAKHGRIGYGVEISPRYCDVIRRRWTRWARENNQEVGSGGLEA